MTEIRTRGFRKFHPPQRAERDNSKDVGDGKSHLTMLLYNGDIVLTGNVQHGTYF